MFVLHAAVTCLFSSTLLYMQLVGFLDTRIELFVFVFKGIHWCIIIKDTLIERFKHIFLPL